MGCGKLNGAIVIANVAAIFSVLTLSSINYFFLAPKLKSSCGLLMSAGMLEIHACSEKRFSISLVFWLTASYSFKQATRLIVNCHS